MTFNLNINQIPTNPIKNDTIKSTAVSNLLTKSFKAKYEIKKIYQEKMVGILYDLFYVS